MPCTGGSYLMIDDFGPTELLPENGDNSIFDNLTVGDKINVEHGEILLTYPPMTTVFNIEKISDGGISDIPAGIVAELKDMGWIVATDSTTSSTDDYNSSITQEKQNQKKKRTSEMLVRSVLASTYFPGRPPAKYLQRK